MSSSSAGDPSGPPLGLSAAEFEVAFPFHFAVGPDLVLRSVGRSLRKLCPHVEVGDPLGRHLRLKIPAVELTFDALLDTARLFIWETGDRQRLRGQMVHQADAARCVFLGSPWLVQPGQLRQLGLFVQDFALHDPIVDLLQLMQSSSLALADSHRLAGELRRQRSELRDANQELARFSNDLKQVHRLTVTPYPSNAEMFDDLLHTGHQIFEVTNGVIARLVGGRLVVDRCVSSGQPVPHEALVEASRAGRSTARVDGDDGARVLIAAPLRAFTEVCGLLAFWDAVERRPFAEQDLDIIELMSLEVGRAIEVEATERERAAAAEELERLSLVASKSHNGVVITDAGGFIEWVNPGFERLTGWKLDEVAGKRPGPLLQGPDTDLLTIERIRYKLTQAVSFSEEILNYRRDGQKMWIALDITPIFDADGSLVRWIALQSDVTARRYDQDRLAQTTTLLVTLIENFQGGVLVEDTSRVIALANPAFCQIFQIPAAARQLVGRPWPEVAPAVRVSVDDGEAFARRLDQIVEAREFCLGEELLLTDGRVLERDSIPIFIDGLWQGQLWVYRDVTWRRREERALRQARQQEAEIGFRIQDTLLFGTPPTDLVGFSVHAVTIPSQTIAGDFFDFFRLGPRVVDMVLGDVMGKGVPAALLGAALKSQFLDTMMRLVLESGGQAPRPEEVVQRVHEVLTPHLMALESFATLVYARVDLERGELTWVDCGHERPLLRRAGETSCEALDGFNLPFGFSTLEEYCQRTVPLGPGDVVLIYSDGVSEATNSLGEQYGQQRLSELLGAWQGVEPRRCLSFLLRDVQDFVEVPNFQDDITCIALRVADAAQAPPPPPGHRIVVSSDLTHLASIRDFVDDVCQRLLQPAVDPEWIDRLQIAVGEAASNIMRHAYDGRTDGEVDVEAAIEPDRLVISLHDRGRAFTPSRIPEPDLGSEREGGFGLFLITQCVDQVRYERDEAGRNTIVLEKLRAQQEN